MGTTYTYKQFGQELKQTALESQALFRSLKHQDTQQINTVISGCKSISIEAFTQEKADKVVNKGANIVGKLIDAAYKILKAIFKKLVEISKKFKVFLSMCRKRGLEVRSKLRLATVEGNKLIRACKVKCDESLKSGITKDYTLIEIVNMIQESTGIKTGPLDPESPAIVRQWLEGIDANKINLRNIEGLRYYIPENVWMYYAFNKGKAILSNEYYELYKNTNNYYLKLTLNARQYLSQDIYFAFLRELLTGKSFIDIETFKEALLNKLILPFYNFELPREEGNITDSTQVHVSKGTVKSIYENSHDKLAGFEAALTLFTPELKQGDPKSYIEYYQYETDMDAMIAYSVNLTKAVEIIEANQFHLLGKNNENLEPKLPMESQVTRLLNEILNDSLTNQREIAECVVNIATLLEKIKSNYYTYWQQLSGIQLRSLDRQQQCLDTFMVII